MTNPPHKLSGTYVFIQMACLTIQDICLLILINPGVTSTTEAQGCFGPPIYPLSDGEFWPKGQPVQVKIDGAFAETDRQALESGNRKWNGSNCSGVTFNGFGDQSFINYEATPPDYTIWWQRTGLHVASGRNAGVFKTYRTNPIGPGRWIVGARIRIRPEYTNTWVPNYFVYLGTHEVGHTLGLRDCLGCAPLT